MTSRKRRGPCAFDIVELSVASLIDQLGAVADKLARQVLLCSEIIMQRAAVALTRGEHDVAHADAVKTPMREQPARRQLQ